jgi:hypothetical protein
MKKRVYRGVIVEVYERPFELYASSKELAQNRVYKLYSDGCIKMDGSDMKKWSIEIGD